MASHPLLIDLNVLPADDPKVDSTKQPEDDLPPSPRLCIALRYPNVPLVVLRKTYKFLESSPVVGNEHLRNLGFSEGGIDTFMCTRDKKAQLPRKPLQALARSWLKEVPTKKNQVIDQENGDEEAKKYSPEHIEQVKAPKAPARMARKKREKIRKQVCALAAPRSGIYKSAPKRVRCISLPRSGKEQSTPKPRSLNDIVDAIEILHGI